MALDESIRREAEEARSRMHDAEHALDLARSDFNHAVRRLHATGGSMREIASAFGLSHQRVHQIVGGEQPPAIPSGPWPFIAQPIPGRKSGGGLVERFSEGGRATVVAAQEEAIGLKQGHVGTEHLLLALLRDPDGDAARLLRRTADEARNEVRRLTRPSKSKRRGRLPFSADSKKALELALREAMMTMQFPVVGPAEILIGIAQIEDSVAGQILRDWGFDLDRLRAAIRRAA